MKLEIFISAFDCKHFLIGCVISKKKNTEKIQKQNHYISLIHNIFFFFF